MQKKQRSHTNGRESITVGQAKDANTILIKGTIRLEDAYDCHSGPKKEKPVAAKDQSSSQEINSSSGTENTSAASQVLAGPHGNRVLPLDLAQK